MKYICINCGYIYDPAVGDPSAGTAPESCSRTFQKTGYVLSVTCQKKISMHWRSHHA